MSSDSSLYPTVATIIGCPEQLTSTNGLVATPIGVTGELQPPTGPFIKDSSQIQDPIQKAIIDNICGGQIGYVINIKSLYYKMSKTIMLVSELIEIITRVGEHSTLKKNLKKDINNALHITLDLKEELLKIENSKQHPTDQQGKVEDYIKCAVCNVDCNGNAAYQSHLSGSRHAKRMKEQEMAELVKLPFIRHNTDSNTYSCTLCCATLNAVSQIGAHISGQKHKNKVENNEPLAKSNENINSDRDPCKPRVDATPNLLYCATCNIHCNSPHQLERHTSSRKHINRVNGRIPAKEASWKWKSRGTSNGPASGIGRSSILDSREPGGYRYTGIGSTPFPKISQTFIPGGQFRPY